MAATTVGRESARRTASDPALLAAAALFVVYALTLAPDVTFWDAGEFIAAAHALGIPHPPGTPLFVLLANVWAKAMPVAFPVATNLLSAAATATAAYVTARLVMRGTGSGAMAVASALAAGSMSTAWLNATETEVYSLSLLLGLLVLATAARAGEEDGERWVRLTAYLMALAVPLHLSALVTAPVAIALAAGAPQTIRWRRVALLGGVFLLALGVGRMSTWMAGGGAVLILGSALAPAGGGVRRVVAFGQSAAVLAIVLVGCSAIAFMLMRAPFDPVINQGNPDTWERFIAVVGRRQYAVAPLWPRMAPPWVQLVNVGQYADWQVALSTGPTVLPSFLRTAGTALFIWLAIAGATWHWMANRRSALLIAGLLACGTVGVMGYLNLRAGPSIGFPGLSPDAPREARERDYFYVFGFWAWGMWAGIGAVHVARLLRRPAWAGLLLAALPIVLNWRAVTRRADGERTLPRRVGEALLESAPPNAVLFVSGDNDTYPLWYLQRVHALRRDVALVTIPLLSTAWYRDEIARRHGLTSVARDPFRGRMTAAAAIAADARGSGRPVAASVSLTAEERARIASSWTAGAPVYVEGPAGIDTAAADRWADWVSTRLSPAAVRPAIDPVARFFREALDCPRLFAEAARAGTAGTSSRLASLCNYR